MPSARALLVAPLLTEPPCGCLGPPGHDRCRKRSLRSQTAGASQINCQSRGGSFAMNRPPADVFRRPLLDDHRNDPPCILSQIAARTESLLARTLGPRIQRPRSAAHNRQGGGKPPPGSSNGAARRRVRWRASEPGRCSRPRGREGRQAAARLRMIEKLITASSMTP